MVVDSYSILAKLMFLKVNSKIPAFQNVGVESLAELGYDIASAFSISLGSKVKFVADLSTPSCFHFLNQLLTKSLEYF